ncbi:MAG: bifunctional folylpolyglutamate synthase/dihydrofolate synthase [Verrucomicrobia bacterium]|nr:bifunctional folylpolyglutamate synthase/dihydrofolate synthase [Verrucomicrobiota bacterium]
MTYEQTVEYLYGIQLFGIKLGLHNIRALLALMGNPHETPPLVGRFIHIAGTNGKGSVAAMLNAIGQRAGLRVGLYTSPHLVSFCERIQVNNQPITEADVVRLVSEIRPLMQRVAEMPEHAHPTFFEAITAIALRYFQERRCDLVVWETGMGGRLDATNIVPPLVSVITNVQNDHATYLGDTIAKIAVEKAGVIKPGVPVVTAASDPVALEVISRIAAEARAPLTVVRPGDCELLGEDLRGQQVRMGGMECAIPLLGVHQVVNAMTAVTAARLALKVSDEMIREGLARTRWPGRFHVMPGKPTVVLDGAHNSAAAEVLGATLEQHFRGQRLTMILGILRDKDREGICRALAPRATEVLTVRVPSERTTSPGELAEICRRAAPGVPVRNANTVAAALEECSERDGVVLVAGSLYLVGETLALVQRRRLEAGLNQ